jgi:hypothetical protein
MINDGMVKHCEILPPPNRLYYHIGLIMLITGCVINIRGTRQNSDFHKNGSNKHVLPKVYKQWKH